MKIGLQLHEAEPVKKAVEANLGIGMISAYAVEREIASGQLETAAVEGLLIPRHLEMVTRRDKYLSPVSQRFMEVAREFFHKTNAEPAPRASKAARTNKGHGA